MDKVFALFVLFLGVLSTFGCGPSSDVVQTERSFHGAVVNVQDGLITYGEVDFEIMDAAYTDLTLAADELQIGLPDFGAMAREEGMRINVIDVARLQEEYRTKANVVYIDAYYPTIMLGYGAEMSRRSFGMAYVHGLLQFMIGEAVPPDTSDIIFGALDSASLDGCNHYSLEGMALRELMNEPVWNGKLGGITDIGDRVDIGDANEPALGGSVPKEMRWSWRSHGALRLTA